MRKKLQSSIRVNYILIYILIVLLLFFNIFIAPNFTSSKGENLEIATVDEINEGELFIVSVYDPEDLESETPFLIDVTINFNNEDCLITTDHENGEIRLQAPEVNQDTIFIISASKTGYNSTEKIITVLDNESQDEPLKLIVTPEDYTVEAGKQFAVFVKDETGTPIPGATVAIQNFGTTRDTDDDGRTWLTAPEDKESITILAQKDGYANGEINIKVNIEPPWWITFINSPYFPIVIAVIFLLFAIVYVNQRQKKSIYSRAKEISNEKTIKKYGSNEKTTTSPSDESEEKLDEHQSSLQETARSQPQHDAKIEEIRISKPRRDKEIIPIKSDEDQTEKVISRKKTQKRDYDWFEGTDDIRYEIDKLTGKVDENGLDKWYEGGDSLKEKIDEKVKKKDKKKDIEDEE